MSAPEDEGEFGLVMPFIVCASRGGPYDDASFVAGFECAVIEGMLTKPLGPTIERYVNPRLIPQLDLIAMRNGWSLESEPWDEAPEEWVLATFTRVLDAPVEDQP